MRAVRLSAIVIALSSLFAVSLVSASGAEAFPVSMNASFAAKQAATLKEAAKAPVLRKGDKGVAVEVLQSALGFRHQSGVFGPVTLHRVKRFQVTRQLPVTGVVNAPVWAALGAAVVTKAVKAVQAPDLVCPAEKFTWGDGWGAPRGGHTHTGMDLMGTRGTPLYAIKDATVISAGYQSNGALTITLRTADGQEFFYGHQYKNFVSEGDTVKAGEEIALMGDTGSPGATHLHVEWWPHGWIGSTSIDSARDIEPLLRTIC